MWHLKKPDSGKHKVEWWLPGVGAGGNGGQNVQRSNYKVKKF